MIYNNFSSCNDFSGGIILPRFFANIYYFIYFYNYTFFTSGSLLLMMYLWQFDFMYKSFPTFFFSKVFYFKESLYSGTFYWKLFVGSLSTISLYYISYRAKKTSTLWTFRVCFFMIFWTFYKSSVYYKIYLFWHLNILINGEVNNRISLFPRFVIFVIIFSNKFIRSSFYC